MTFLRLGLVFMHWRRAPFTVFLFLILLIALGQVSLSYAAKTVKVGNTAASCGGPCDFTGIAEAITASAAGDTISVYPGQYAPFTIDKAVMVAAAGDRDTTIVQGSTADKFVVLITANGAKVSGFTIRNSSLDGIRVFNASNVIVENNYVTQTAVGAPAGFRDPQAAILIHGGKGDQVLNNLVVDNNGRGIRVEGLADIAEGHLVKGNTVTRSLGGCALVVTSNVINNVFDGNKISFGHGGGIILASVVPGAVVKGNIFQNNEVKSTLDTPGILLSNTIPINPPDLFTGNIVRYNWIEGNQGYRALPDAPDSIGIVLERVTGNQVYGNTIRNQLVGIAATTPTLANEIRGNDVTGVPTVFFQQAAAPAPVVPAALPNTGDDAAPWMALMAAVGVGFLGLGVALRRRRAY